MLAGFEDAQPSTPETSPEVADQIDDPRDLTGRVVYVVDAHSLIYQVFHAMPEMSSPAGQPVGATHGFTRDVLDLIEKKKPDYLFVAFDHPSEGFRAKIYPQYKANRESMPVDLRSQIGDIRRMLDALGVAAISCPGYEADDIMATMAKEVDHRGGRCLLVTSDKDCRQLLTERVKLYNIRKNLIYDADELLQDWGIRPDQVVDFQALVGDAVDNVPGVPLIGPVLARQLLERYGNLESVLQNAEHVSGVKRRENLMNGRDQAMMSRELVRLVPDSPIEVDWRAGRVGGVQRDSALQLCREFGFRRLADRIAGLAVQHAPTSWDTHYELIADEQSLRSLVERLRAGRRFSLDTETTAPNPRWAEIVGYSFSWEEGQAAYVPVRAPAGDPCVDAQRAAELLKPILEDPTIEKIGQNLKYDAIALRGVGIELAGLAFDTMVADYLLSPGERTHDLNDLSKRYLNHQTVKIKELIGVGSKQKRMDQVPVDKVAHYAAEDADIPMRLVSVLEERLADEQLTELYRETELPLLHVLADMEYLGIRVDVELLATMSERFSHKLAELEAEIHVLAGEPFNIESPKQLAGVLFDRLKLPVIKKTKTGPSTDAEVLAQLAELHPLPAKIVEYRQQAKLKSTYVDALPELVHPETGRVHTSFKQDVAATGRLSSQDPNLQNIPIHTAEGREIRGAFLPAEGCQLLAADYSQIELRVLAHFCGDAAMRDAFDRGEDIHTRVAGEVFDTPLDGVTSEMRRRAKAVNFGVVYGQTPFGLAKALGIEKQEAADFIDAYFDRYPGVDEFVAETLDRCRENGYVSTILGRRRTVEGVRSRSRRGESRFRNLPERIAVNTVIQGSAADLIKTAMIQIHRRLKRETLTARMLLQIHDELVFEVPSDQITPLANLVTQEMTSAAQLTVPLQVDVKHGANWADCQPWEP